MKKKRQNTFYKWIWIRRIAQAIFVLAFLYLLMVTVQGVTKRLPNDLFFHVDPLIGITSMLASRSWITPMILSVITLVLTLIIGRAWCGWVCPMGTILDWIPSRRRRSISPRWSQIKYFTLFTIIISAALGSLMFVVLDPVTLLFRTMAGAILPGLNWVIEGVEYWLYGFPVLRPVADWFGSVSRGWLLNSQPFYPANLALLAAFMVVLGLNAVRPRFWCRYLCPLGGLLGLVSKVSFIRHTVNNEKCISCGKCAARCPTGAIKLDNSYVADESECTICLGCVDVCPTGAVSFVREYEEVTQERSRRRFLYSMGAAAMLAAFFRFLPVTARTNDKSVRPPGSSEQSLYDQCVRCGECVRICPTGVIQPNQTGTPADLWSPALKTRLGYCDYSCNSCGVICPTGAIRNLPLELKRKTMIGTAIIDQSRCITWAEGRDCIVCEEMCPVPEKAIRLGGGGQGRGSGKGRHPRVIEDLCIGCGICEYQCPVAGESAIRVFPPAIKV